MLFIKINRGRRTGSEGRVNEELIEKVTFEKLPEENEGVRHYIVRRVFQAQRAANATILRQEHFGSSEELQEGQCVWPGVRLHNRRRWLEGARGQVANCLRSHYKDFGYFLSIGKLLAGFEQSDLIRLMFQQDPFAVILRKYCKKAMCQQSPISRLLMIIWAMCSHGAG